MLGSLGLLLAPGLVVCCVGRLCSCTLLQHELCRQGRPESLTDECNATATGKQRYVWPLQRGAMLQQGLVQTLVSLHLHRPVLITEWASICTLTNLTSLNMTLPEVVDPQVRIPYSLAASVRSMAEGIGKHSVAHI